MLAVESHLFLRMASFIEHKMLNTLLLSWHAGAQNVYFGVGDVAMEADVARLYSEAMEKLGGIDVAVLNAGVARHGNIETISIENFDLQFNTNVRGVFLWLKHILPHMKVCNGP